MARTRRRRSWPTRREFNIFSTDKKLAAIEQAAKMLASFPEKKALVYFSGGVSRNGLDNEAQLQSAINAATKANLAIYSDRYARPDGGASGRRRVQGRFARRRASSTGRC